MPFDGSGNFTRDYNFEDDRVNGIRIVATRVDGEFDNFATGMNQVMLRNGVAAMTGALNMGTYTINSLGDGASGNPAIKFNSDGTSGLYSPGFSKVALTAGGVKRIEANSTGVAVVGALDVTGALNATGAATLGDALTVTGALTIGSYVGNLAVPGTFAVTGASTLTGAVTAGAGIDITGDLDVASGNTTLGGTLTVSGTTVSVGATATTGLATFNGGVTVPSGGLNVGGAGANYFNNLYMQGDGTNGYVRTTTSGPLILGANGGTTLYVTPTGLVGVGTASPSSALGVNGDLTIMGGGDLVITPAISGGDASIYNDVGVMNLGIKGASARVRIDNSATLDVDGRVDCRTPSDGSTGGLRIRGNASSGFAHLQITDAGATAQWGYVRVSADGNWIWSGDITAFSDERLKTNWRGLGRGFVEKLAQVKSGIYDRIDTGVTQAGVSAQSLLNALPEAVRSAGDGMLSVNYGAAALVSAVDLAREIVALKAMVADLARKVR